MNYTENRRIEYELTSKYAKMDKNKWIEEVLNSTEGMSKAMPKRDLFVGIEQKLNRGYKKTVPLRTVSLVAASILLLVTVNVMVLLSGDDKGHSVVVQQPNQETMAEYYGLTETNLY